VIFPNDMGLKLPDSGGMMIQWHHFNSTGAVAMDGSAVQMCTVPAAMRKNIGGLTFLGNENFNGGMPPGQKSDVTGTCTNSTGKPITIVGFNPHMHLLGVNMKSIVTKGGMMDPLFDHAFQFDHQVNYMINPGYVLNAGDSITSTCTFNNTTTASVNFGTSTKEEMCYQFTFAYPYGALNNGVLSLIGATNTCW
jgi:Copper type II ascorbate-dependent monooxygenase, C-terminal domain